MKRQRSGVYQYIELTTQLIITICYSKHDDNKTRNDVCDKTMIGELNGIVNPILREKIDKSIVGKLIDAKVNFLLGAPIKAKKNPKIY